MQLGNIYTGYNWENIYRMANISKITEERCKNCWALTQCNICASVVVNHGGNLVNNVPNNLCVTSRSSFKKDLLDIIALQETADLKSLKEMSDTGDEEKRDYLPI